MGIEEIRQRKNEGKKKWGVFLVAFIKQSFDKNTPYDFIVKELNDKYQISLSTHELTNLIYSFNKKTKTKQTVGSNLIQKPINLSEETEKKKIVLNEDSTTNDILALFDKTDNGTPNTEKPKTNPFKK